MTNTAKDTSSTDAQPLSWTRTNDWGSNGGTYRAAADGWDYCVDSPRKGQWVLRGWGPGNRFLYRDGRTMKAMKQLATDHSDELLGEKAADKVRDTSPDGPWRLSQGNPQPVDLSGFEPATVATVATPMVPHTWVAATDGDTGAVLDWQHCGVCGIRRCDGGCGDPSVGATPDPDCPTHGTPLGQRCNGSAVTCNWLPGDATTACDWDRNCPVHGVESYHDIPDDQCLDRDGYEYPEHDYGEVDCRRCGAEPDLLSD